MVKNGVEPSRMQMFFLTHTKKDGTPVDQRAADKIDEMQRLMDLQPEGYQDNVAKDGIFSQVMGEDRHGRVRMMGLGVKPSTLWGPRPTRQQLEREAIDARRDATEARWEAAEARRTVNEGFTILVSPINQRLGGEPIDLATILRGISAQAPPNGGHLAPDSSSDPSA